MRAAPRRTYQLFPMGEFSARDGRPGTLKSVKAKTWKLDASLAATLVARWQQRETPLVVDYEHQTMNAAENGKPCPGGGLDRVAGGGAGRPVCHGQMDGRRPRVHPGGRVPYISPVFLLTPKPGPCLN